MSARAAVARGWRPGLAAAVLMAANGAVSIAVAGDTVDFSEQTTPVCEVEGLRATPPDGWFNVPIDSAEPTLRGCQMMRTREDEALVGIARVLSVTLSEPTVDPPWQVLMLSFERDNIARMGYVPGDVLWRRDNVPIAGTGFTGGLAVGLSARIEGNEAPQEVQFLIFERALTKYVVTLLTPGRSVENGLYYDRNVADFGKLIGGFMAPAN